MHYPRPHSTEDEIQKDKENSTRWMSRRILLPQKLTPEELGLNPSMTIASAVRYFQNVVRSVQMFTGWEKELLTTLQDVKLSKTYSHVKFVPDCGKRPEEIDMASTECESEEEKEEDDNTSYQTSFYTTKHEALLKYTYYYLAYVCLLEGRN